MTAGGWIEVGLRGAISRNQNSGKSKVFGPVRALPRMMGVEKMDPKDIGEGWHYSGKRVLRLYLAYFGNYREKGRNLFSFLSFGNKGRGLRLVKYLLCARDFTYIFFLDLILSSVYV